MTSAVMSTHKAYKALQRAGIDDQQAEAMVEIFTDMQQAQPGEQVGKQLGQIQTKVDQIDQQLGQLQTKVGQIDQRLGHVERTTDKLVNRFNQLEAKVDKIDVTLGAMDSRIENLRNDVVTLTTDMRWIKRLFIVMTTTLLVAAMKTFFI